MTVIQCKQILARIIQRRLLALHDGRAAQAEALGQLLAQALGQRAHALYGLALQQAVHNLAGAVGRLAQLAQRLGELLQIHIQQRRLLHGFGHLIL